jgi:hypothetical protein
MRRAALIGVAVAVLAVLAVVRFVPWLTAKQDVELSSPTSSSLMIAPTLVPVQPGHVVCIATVDLAPSYRSAHLLVGKPATLALTLSAPGYSSTTRARTSADAVPLALPIHPPPRPTLGRACVRNEGQADFLLFATGEPRTQSRPVTTVDGKPIPQDVALSFWRGKRESRLAALLGGIHKMAAFKPVGAWFFWALLVLVAVGVPAAVVAAFVLSAPGAEDRDVVEGVRQ